MRFVSSATFFGCKREQRFRLPALDDDDAVRIGHDEVARADRDPAGRDRPVDPVPGRTWSAHSGFSTDGEHGKSSWQIPRRRGTAASMMTPARPIFLHAFIMIAPMSAQVWSPLPSTTRTSPGLAIAMAAWIIRLSPGRTSTVSAGPANFIDGASPRCGRSACRDGRPRRRGWRPGSRPPSSRSPAKPREIALDVGQRSAHAHGDCSWLGEFNDCGGRATVSRPSRRIPSRPCPSGRCRP